MELNNNDVGRCAVKVNVEGEILCTGSFLSQCSSVFFSAVMSCFVMITSG